MLLKKKKTRDRVEKESLETKRRYMDGIVCELYIPAQQQQGTFERYLYRRRSPACNRKYKLKWFKQ